MGHAKTKAQRLLKVWSMLMREPEGVSVMDVQRTLDVDYSTAHRYLNELGAQNYQRGLWSLEPSADDVKLARAILKRARQYRHLETVHR